MQRFPFPPRIFLLVVLCIAFAPFAAQAQTISPVIAEYYGTHAEGSFQIRNDSLSPFTVVLKPMSFSVDSDGQPVFRALGANISLEFSSASFRVPPRRQFTVYYRVRVSQVPAWFTIYASIISNAKAGAMNLVIELPHTVYLLDKTPLSSSEIVFQKAEVDPRTGWVSASIQNTSTNFERVTEISLSSNSSKQIYAGFPFFPGQRRVVRLGWTKPGTPREIQLRFRNFRVKDHLEVRSASP